MLRRCMTPNPNSKTKYLSELVGSNEHSPKQKTDKISYDTFVYVDRLTNHKIQLGEAKNIYSQKDRKVNNTNLSSSRNIKRGDQTATSRHKDYSQTKQMEEINNCFSLMKSTKHFQMETLKSKLFNRPDSGANRENQLDQMIKKKKQIREFIEQYLNSLCLTEFRKYMEPNDQNKVKLINPNLLKINKVMTNKISKQNLEKIIEEFLHSEGDQQKKKAPLNINIDDVAFPEEERLKELILHRLFVKNKEFEYLVNCNHSKRIYNQIQRNRTQRVDEGKHRNQPQNLQQFQFQEFAEGSIPKFDKPQRISCKPIDKNLEIKKRELLISIETGSIYNFLFLIIRWPSLLHYHDKLGNSLLHMAGKQNQPEIFSMLVQKLGYGALKEKNNCGKTPMEVSKLFCSHDVEKLAEEFQDCF